MGLSFDIHPSIHLVAKIYIQSSPIMCNNFIHPFAEEHTHLYNDYTMETIKLHRMDLYRKGEINIIYREHIYYIYHVA